MQVAFIRRAACLAAAISIAACSNATAIPPNAGAPVATRAKHHGKGTLVLRIRVPKTHRHKRRAHYISPSTQSMTVAIAGPTPVNQTVGLTPTSTGCSSTLTGTFCTLTIPGLSPGSYTATIGTYDAANGTGTVLSSAQAVPFTVVAGTSNSIAMTLAGIPAATIVSPADANSIANGYNTFVLEGQGPKAFLVHAIDADGNIIVGAGAPTFTIGSPTGPLAGVTTSPSSTTTTAPNSFTVSPPSSYASGYAQFTVTPTFSGQSTDGCAQTGAVCSGATVTVSMVPSFSWTQLSPASSPSARNTVMAYDTAMGDIVLFGGVDGSFTLHNDTWAFDGATWTQLSPASSPPARFVSAMTYDAGHNTVVLFGGASSVVLNDTWTWNGTNWTRQSPATSPAARQNESMVYDALRGTVVLFGGNTGSGNLNDTWTWDGTNWTQQFPATSPPARQNASMAFDAKFGTVVLFGGNNPSPLNDTWTWNGTNWTQQSPAASPSARGSAAMDYDPALGTAVLFGGFSASGYLSDAWTWNRTTWTQLAPASSPSARANAQMNYDAMTNALVLFGGYNGAELGDTWSGL